MGKRFILNVSEADKALQSQSSVENARRLKALGSRCGRPRGARSRASKAEQLKDSVRELREQGLSLSEIALRLGISRNTASRALRLTDIPAPAACTLTIAFIRRQLKLAQRSCKYISDFYVSSDDEKILAAAEKCGYKRIVRPSWLAAPTAQHVDAVKHALGVMSADGCDPDILVVLLANSGIIKTEWIEESITNLMGEERLSASCPVMLEMDHHPYRSKRLREDGCLDTWFDFEGQQISTNRQDLPKNFVFCHNFWTLRLSETLKSAHEGQKPWTFMGNNVKPIVVEESFDVHSEEDIVKTEKWLMKEGIAYER